MSPRLIFLVCALLGAASNASAVLLDHALYPLMTLRFATGFFLAGIYPVGMKIAAGWFDKDLGRALGYLVGALVAGTALPHLIRGLGQTLPWQEVTLAVSALATAGGVLMYTTMTDGPYQRPSAPFNHRALLTVFQSRNFRASAFGYFGHMWELYAFWAFVPAFIAAHVAFAEPTSRPLNISLWSFAVIGIAVLSCIGGGLASPRWGSARVAGLQLAASGLCCLVSPLMFWAPTPIFLAFLLLWGLVVAGDSPQFSALNARAAPPEWVGSALTIANSVGFAVSIVSIQLVNLAVEPLGASYVLLLLAPGPVVGVLALRPLLRRNQI